MEFSPSSDPVARLHCLFSGEVQGVGFRRHTERQALALGLRGWVRNLPDGRVEMVAEGPPADLEALVKHLEGRFHVTQNEFDRLPPTGEFASFCILR
jgi:acylphosphatase